MKRILIKDERGFVLLVVLAGLAFLSFIAAATISSSRHAARMAAARAGQIEADLLAEGGLSRAILAIDESYSDQAWPENGAPVRFALGQGTVIASIVDEAGKLDLVAAPDLMIDAVFAHIGIAPSRKEALLSALRKERAAATVERRPFAPDSLEALGRVIGLETAEVAALRPLATVHNGLGGFDAAIAPKELSALIPGMGAADFKTVSRADAPERAGSPAPAFTATSPRRIFTIRAEACTASGFLAVREALIERRAPARYARIELREPIEARFFTAPCDRQKLAAATDR